MDHRNPVTATLKETIPEEDEDHRLMISAVEEGEAEDGGKDAAGAFEVAEAVVFVVAEEGDTS